MKCNKLSIALLLLPALATADFLVNNFRDYKCKKLGSTVDCRLSFEGNEEWDAVNDNGCFKEFNTIREEVIEWCPLQCPDAENAFVVEKPSVPGCSTSETFGIEQRKNDWFFWRASPCDQEETTFRLACRMNLTQKKRHPKLLKTTPTEVQNEIEVDEEMINSSEEEPSSNQIKATDAETDDAIVQDVDTLLRIMFPSYRSN